MTTNTNVNRFAALYSLFQYAVSQKLMYPKIRLQAGNDTVIVKLAGSQSRYTGQLMVTNDAGYGALNNKYFGRIDMNGAIVAGRDLTPAIEALLEEFAANPVEVAQRYGHLTGNCMFCGKQLDDPTSVACGYGPVCARKWNLPHSAATQSRKARKSPVTQPTVDATEEVAPTNIMRHSTPVDPMWTVVTPDPNEVMWSGKTRAQEDKENAALVAAGLDV